MSDERVTTGKPLPLRARRRALAYGAAVVLMIMVAACVSLHPILTGRSDGRGINQDAVMLQQVADLRTSLADWQLYIEPLFTKQDTSAGAIDPKSFATLPELTQTETTRARGVSAALRSRGLSGPARDLDRAAASLARSFSVLAPVGPGAPKTTDISAERAAFAKVWNVTASLASQLDASRTRGSRNLASHLDNGGTAVLVMDVLVALATVSGAIVLGQRARRREHKKRTTGQHRDFEATLQRALEMSQTESDAYDVLTRALRPAVPQLQVEMLVADSSRAHFQPALKTGSTTGMEADERSGCGVSSPLDCPATRGGHTLVFPTSRALDACPHLIGRPSGECSAVCVAVSFTGQTAGVMHATGPDGVPPTEADVRYLEVTSRRGSERIAMLRAFEKSEAQARSDPLTGLWNRRSLENRVNELEREGVAYAVAFGDLDHFKRLNDTYGHEAGDQALRLFSRVLRESIRPNDISARYGGEEFIIVLPDCSVETAAGVLERLREGLALTLTSGRIPAFTVSFGLASSIDADTFDEVVAIADEALLAAKSAGRNRTVLAAGPSQPQQVDEAPACDTSSARFG